MTDEPKTQTIENLMSALDLPAHEMSAVASWTGERCWTIGGEPIKLWTYGEMLALSVMYLDGGVNETPADPRRELEAAARAWYGRGCPGFPDPSIEALRKAIEALG